MEIDLRILLAEEICDRIGARLYPGRCDCGSPLLELRGQNVPCCWNCAADNLAAQRAWDLLERIKRGITIRHVGNEAFVEERAVRL